VERAIVGGHGAPGESDSRAQKLAALVEHTLLDRLIGSPEHGRRDRQRQRLRGLTIRAEHHEFHTTRLKSASISP
jgi:hypothetical protein